MITKNIESCCKQEHNIDVDGWHNSTIYFISSRISKSPQEQGPSNQRRQRK